VIDEIGPPSYLWCCLRKEMNRVLADNRNLFNLARGMGCKFYGNSDENGNIDV
jgi:hypothetical protein